MRTLGKKMANFLTVDFNAENKFSCKKWGGHPTCRPSFTTVILQQKRFYDGRSVCTQLISDKNILVVVDKIRKVDKYGERI